ncbi:MAG: major facilitator superfamily 1, partial [Gammaproteobacteria bacterium]|nr:major facilitator superfamily 1 [Gammaproteobacteria bacterium]
EPERNAILRRIHPDGPGVPERSIGPALRDGRVGLLGIFMLCMLGSSYAYGFFAPGIVQRISGFSITGTGFLMAAMYVLGAAAMLGNGILADRARDPYWCVLPGCFLMSAGFLALALASVPWVALTGLLVIIVGHMSMQGPLWSISTSFLKGRAAAAGIATMNMIGILGGFIGPYWMGIAKDLTGNDQRGLLTMAVPMLIAAAIMMYLRRRARQPSALIMVPVGVTG